MNFAWRREITPELMTKITRDSAVLLLMWAIAIASLPLRAFIIWFEVMSLVSFVNTLRTLAAHRYEGDGTPFDRGGQLRDSVDVPGQAWTELWAPVGLRYHALHHYFPGIPYHNLAAAHRRLTEALPPDAVYRDATRSGLLASLRPLVLGKRKQAPARS
jgi:fatty acid desaturase